MAREPKRARILLDGRLMALPSNEKTASPNAGRTARRTGRSKRTRRLARERRGINSLRLRVGGVAGGPPVSTIGYMHNQ